MTEKFNGRAPIREERLLAADLAAKELEREESAAIAPAAMLEGGITASDLERELTESLQPFDPNVDERFNVPGYQTLARILEAAYDQAARGKGRSRHANNLPFDDQPIMQIARMSGLGGHVYQIMKKAQEAGTMANRRQYDAAQAEFMGVINYAAAAILLVSEKQAADRGEGAN